MIEIGDLVKHTQRKTQGVVIAMKKPNSTLVCDGLFSPTNNTFWVYYVLLNSGDVEGPLFQGEISQI